MLGGRSPRLVLDSIFEPNQYRALARMVTRYPAFPRVARRYFLGGGRYPYACRIRTPTGTVAPITYSHHDIFTVHEIFGREDYAAGNDLRVVVDIGSNVGISALYFLTRNHTSRCYARTGAAQRRASSVQPRRLRVALHAAGSCGRR